jgi:hypothetical protein
MPTLNEVVLSEIWLALVVVYVSTFQTSGIYVGGGVFILAYFYRRRSIVKAGAAAGGV